MLLPFIKAGQAEEVNKYDLCEGADPNVEKNEEVSDVGSFLTGIIATWKSPPGSLTARFETTDHHTEFCQYLHSRPLLYLTSRLRVLAWI